MSGPTQPSRPRAASERGVAAGHRRRRRSGPRRRRGRRRAGFGLGLAVTLGGLGGGAIPPLAGPAPYIDDLPQLDSLEAVDLGENSSIYAADGTRINLIPRD